jgi:hypothetical protein
VVDGRLHLARVEHGAVKTSTDYEGKRLSSCGPVPAWRTRSASARPPRVRPISKLVEARRGRPDGSRLTLPVPAARHGEKGRLPRPEADRSLEAARGVPGHADSALNLTSGERVTIIGFYSKAHEGVFTHHGSYAHLHILLPNGDSGHVDELEVGPEIELLLPRSWGSFAPARDRP